MSELSKRYRKRPVVVDAVKLVSSNTQRASEWCDGLVVPVVFDIRESRWIRTVDMDDELRNLTLMFGHGLVISTLEGNMLAAPGDYIIKGVNGEFYPCKPDIFESTYEPVEDVDD